MFDIFKGEKFRVIELSDTVKIETNIADIYLPALRAGFVGFPTNPRWSAIKFHAWKVGRQWRNGLNTGELKVRVSDSILVHRDEEEPPGKPEHSLEETVEKFSLWNLKLNSPFSIPST
ncbi:MULTISPECIES: hypothetical protein [Spirulina sp. CCY15215]|uniref:hypothetical protein n=1 Tax=Spirulina sp. CCY15215 TaxID=2767591 RepID=UPI00195086F3|nr:hypothetical protein [Spirulina major]